MRRLEKATGNGPWKSYDSSASRSPNSNDAHGTRPSAVELDGFATRKELGQASYQAEGAAFYLETFEYQPEHEDPESREGRLLYDAERRACIEVLVKEVEAVHAEELRRLTADDPGVSTQQLLTDAAYFVNSAMNYPFVRPRESVIDDHKRFLSLELLREIVGSQFRSRQD